MPDRTVLVAKQIDIKLRQTEVSLAKMLEYAGEAAGNRIDLVVFPECTVTGYQFDTRDEALAVAQTVPGPATNVFSSFCAELSIHVIIGLLERSGESLFNTSVLVGPEAPVCVYHKNHVAFQAVDRFVEKGDKPFELCTMPKVCIGPVCRMMPQ